MTDRMDYTGKADAYTLPEYMRQMVIAECREQTKIDPSSRSVFIVLSAVFIGCGITAVIISGGALSAVVLAAFFFSVFFMLTYIIFIKPRKLLKKAEANDYKYYIGTVTDKNDIYGEYRNFHQLTIDGTVKCACTDEQYRKAEIGDRYMAVYFGGNDPDLCLKAINKEII